MRWLPQSTLLMLSVLVVRSTAVVGNVIMLNLTRDLDTNISTL